MTVLPGVDVVAMRLAGLRRRIAEHTDRPVSVVAVTKAFPPDVVRVAVAAGITAIGENYAQELRVKSPVVDDVDARPEVHFIGRLQSNKVRSLVGIVDVWDSLDRTSVIDAVATRAGTARVLIQVNATAEDGKGGCPIGEAPALVSRALDRGLRVEGLMTVGPTAGGPEAARPAFRAVRRLVDELGLAVCSMGMTADLDIALDEGSTQVRVGSLLFGDRERR